MVGLAPLAQPIGGFLGTRARPDHQDTDGLVDSRPAGQSFGELLNQALGLGKPKEAKTGTDAGRLERQTKLPRGK